VCATVMEEPAVSTFFRVEEFLLPWRS